MNTTSKNKYLIKNTIALSIGNFGSKLIAFFLVPLYTNVLTTAEYGTIDLITIIGTVVVPLITLNIQESVLRFAMDKDIEQKKVLNIGTMIMFIAMIITILFSPILFLFNQTAKYAIYLVLYMLTLIGSQIYLCYIRGREKLFDYSVISIIQALMIAILNIIFLLEFKMGINGYIMAYIISYFTTFILCIYKSKTSLFFNSSELDKKLTKEMIKYSVILIPNSLMWWIMNSLDRVMITSMIGIDANGLYAVSYKIPTILITLTTIFNQAWMFSAVKEKDSIDKNEYTNNVFSSLFNIVVSVSLFLLLILKPLMTVYVGKDFYSSWLYTPPLLIGTVFLTLGTFIANEYTAHKDSMGYLKSSTIGAICNILLNLILIPTTGIIGAAIATCVSYVVVLLFRIVDTKKYLKIKFLDSKRIVSIFLLFVSSMIIYVNFKYMTLFLLISFVINIIITRDFWKKLILSCIRLVKRSDNKK